ncbi:hypothetical protein ES705_46508 [subsurface metagenome]
MGKGGVDFALYPPWPLVAVDEGELHATPLKIEAGDYILIVRKQLAAGVRGTNDIRVKEQEMGRPQLR